MSILDFLHLGSAMSLRSFLRMGFGFSAGSSVVFQTG